MRRSRIYRIGLVMALITMIVPQSMGMALAGSPPAAPAGSRAGVAPAGPAGSDQPPPLPHNSKYKPFGGDTGGDDPFARAEWFYGLRASGSPTITFGIEDAAAARAKAAAQVEAAKGQTNSPSTVQPYNSAWSPLGPDPIVQTNRVFPPQQIAVTGRIGALAIRSTSPYTMYLGGAQGGVWVSSTTTSNWTALTDQLGSLAIGAIALAPSDENVIYVGTGEGALSGDSYFGNGVLKSIDGGQTFTNVSGSTFNQVSISKIVVDPNVTSTVYATTLSGVAGTVDVRANNATPYGIWKSIDGGVTWSGLVTTTNRLRGATDIVMDPLITSTLYASFLGQGISKTVDSGLNWTSVMTGFPVTATFDTGPSRFALGLSHPISDANATLYTGFDWYDSGILSAAHYHHSTVWKSTNNGASWSITPDLGTGVDQVNGYCDKTGAGSQCTYDNVIAVDPISATIVYALGLFNYSAGSGGIYRSIDGGTHWVDIGYGLHPDYHAIAIRRDAPQNIVIGNDGGAWSSPDRGGRPNGAADASSLVDWVDLNGTVDPVSGVVQASSGLQISEFTGIAQNPTKVGRLYGGLQDNGTLRKSSATNTWFDLASGDGGHVLVDPTNPQLVYGTYPGLSPFRFSDGMNGFLSNASIVNGIDQTDRSAFYIPMEMDQGNPGRLYLGSDRLYRTDNANTTYPGDVLWQAASPDLTSGCPNRNSSPTSFACVITAIGTTAGGPFVYVGTGDGRVWLSTNATSASPTWTRIDAPASGLPLPIRPIAAIAVDRSNYRIAYVAYSGFNAASPFSQSGHVFMTTNGGQSWSDVSSNLPDVPLNSIVIDPSNPNDLYVGSDVGPLATYNQGASWAPLGTGFPIVTVAQLNINPYTRLMRAASYGRGVWSVDDSAHPSAALQIAATDTGVPVGPGSLLTYRVTVQNIGSIAATSVVITNPLPANTTFVSAGSGGVHVGNNVVWNVGSVALPSQVLTGPPPLNSTGLQPGSVTVTFTVQISGGLSSGDVITNDGFSTHAAGGLGATGSPTSVTLAPTKVVALLPSSQSAYAHPGTNFTYQLAVHNQGSATDSYSLSTSGFVWPATVWNQSFTSHITQTGNLAPGAVFTFGVKIAVPATATVTMSDTATISAVSQSNPAVNSSATVQTRIVLSKILLVDEDGNAPDVNAYYTAALNSAGATYDVWDLAADPNLPISYMEGHQAIIWFTGTSFQDPLGPYESRLNEFVNNGGNFFLSGFDVLDFAGSTPFIPNVLHVQNWTSAFQNDVHTVSVTGIPTSPVSSGIGTVPLNYPTIDYCDCNDDLTPASPALPAFIGNPNGIMPGLSVDTGTYKVVFLAFPFEAMGGAADQAKLMNQVLIYFGLANHRVFLPHVRR
jgi:uncharacterized repeat protein (TIGR01451 family)